jgi:hypothetical protein
MFDLSMLATFQAVVDTATGATARNRSRKKYLPEGRTPFAS